MKILAAALESCVHVAGLQSFLEIARSMGYETVFLGPAVPVKQVVAAIESYKPDIVALSYRLSPENARCIFDDLRREMTVRSHLNKPRMFFGGTPSVVAVAKEAGVFDVFFEGGETRDAVVRVLGGTAEIVPQRIPPHDLVSRIQSSYPVPLIRHHFGLPSLRETVEGARRIAESGSVDIISIAPDQNAQEFFFSQSEMDLRMDGAGGVPLRSPEDLKEIFRATRTGNHPLLRCYSGTTDLIKWAKMLKETINVAWGAVPLTWYSELDNRSKRPLEQAIAENQQAIRWYAEQGIPVEV
ncbi:MAG: cobalamin B12-binding domain-containing protein, partial [Thermoplasmata archaeon]